jgi:hypothetical protein
MQTSIFSRNDSSFKTEIPKFQASSVLSTLD